MKVFSYKNIGFLLGPIAFFSLLYLSPLDNVSLIADKVIAVVAWMVIWWVSEAVSIFITALIPIVLFPLLGIMNIKEVCPHYSNQILYLFFGGLVIALALEKVQLHKRFALNILRLTGTNANGIVLGFMLASALMSMWISNTATSIIMLPIAISVVDLIKREETKSLKENDSVNSKKYRNFAISIMLGIAYSANVGGVGTIIGTPPNVFMVGYMSDSYGIDIGMGQWMLVGVPFTLIMLGIIYCLSVYVFYPNRLGKLKLSGKVIQSELKKLGRVNKKEKIVMVIFLTTVFLWIFQRQIKVWIPSLGNITIAMLGAFAMLVVPSNLRKREFILQWRDMKRFPWGIIILFGGGIALAAALSKAGLIDMIAHFASSQVSWSLLTVTIFLIAFVLFATELMSNIALITIGLPLITGVAIGLGAPLLYVVVPVTIACSCAFTLPISTPPNAIVYSSGHIKIHEMARIGIFLNIITILVLIIIAEFVVPAIFL